VVGVVGGEESSRQSGSAARVIAFILRIIRRLLGLQGPGHFAYRVGRPERKEPVMLELNCTNEEKIKIAVAPVTTTGKLARLDGSIQVSVQSGEGVIEMIDFASFFAVSGDNPGDTAFLVFGDADLGEGVETISDVVMLHVAGAKAASLGMTAESPVPK
jgi:hypothetical protein